MPRGGRRQGKPGSLYANRADLAQGARQLPVTTAPGQPYGEAKQQQDAQRAVPMGTPMPQAPAPQGAAPQQSFGDLMDAARNYQPTPVVPMGMESMRPGEHIMTGAQPQQPPMQPSPVLKGVALLNALGDNAPPEVKALRNVLAAQQGNEQAP